MTVTKLYTYKDETHTLKEWSDITGIPLQNLYLRLRAQNWTLEKALTTPVRPHIGVRFSTQQGYVAAVQFNGKRFSLAGFKTRLAAEQARLDLLIELEKVHNQVHLITHITRDPIRVHFDKKPTTAHLIQQLNLSRTEFYRRCRQKKLKPEILLRHPLPVVQTLLEK